MLNKNIDLLKSRSQEKKIIESYLLKELRDKSIIRILEAGCGRGRWPFEINRDRDNYFIDGVDIDKKALDFRKNEIRDLNKIILGDLRSVELNENEYDVIYSSFVLEHIKNSKQVMDNFHRWLKPGGLLILKIPDRNSVAGYITRKTPFWVHIVYKKYIYGRRHAGKPGFGPYPTFHEAIISREGIHNYCNGKNFNIEAEYGQFYDLNRPGYTKILERLFVRIFSMISFGKLRWEYGGLTFIIKKGSSPN